MFLLMLINLFLLELCKKNIFTITARIGSSRSRSNANTLCIHFNVNECKCARTLNLMLHHIGCASLAPHSYLLIFSSLYNSKLMENKQITCSPAMSLTPHTRFSFLFLFLNLLRMKLIIVLFFMT